MSKTRAVFSTALRQRSSTTTTTTESSCSPNKADVVPGCRAGWIHTWRATEGHVGVVDGVLVDRAFVPERATHAVELVATAQLSSDAPQLVANTLAAAAVSRSFGVSIDAVRDAATGFTLDAHRGETVGHGEDVRYIDNSKATNVHAAERLSARKCRLDSGGTRKKGGTFDDLVAPLIATGSVRSCLLGHRPEVIADALTATRAGGTGDRGSRRGH